MDGERLAELRAALAAELHLLEDLVALEAKKTAVLVAGQAAELDVLVKGEQVLVWQLGKAEERRQALLQLLAPDLGLPAAHVTLTGLAERLPPAAGSELADLHRRCGAACAELARRNRQNGELIQGALAYVEFALQTLQPGAVPGSVYTAAAQRDLPRRGAPGRLDGRA